MGSDEQAIGRDDAPSGTACRHGQRVRAARHGGRSLLDRDSLAKAAGKSGGDSYALADR